MADLRGREKALVICHLLDWCYPGAQPGVRFSTPFELLIAGIVGVRTMAPVTNAVTVQLFHKYHGPDDFARADEAVLAAEIRPVGLSRQKARRITTTSRTLLAKHQGQVPSSMKALTELPGVGRKTANLVLVLVFGQPGIIVDGHVNRVSNRTGIVNSKDADVTERKLRRLLPVEYWTKWSFVTMAHGRRICSPRDPHCRVCPIVHLCPHGMANMKRNE